jgi:hypothetical protein
MKVSFNHEKGKACESVVPLALERLLRDRMVSVATAQLGSALAQLHVANRNSGSGSEAAAIPTALIWLSSAQKWLSRGS